MPHRDSQRAPDPFARLWDVGPPPTPNDALRWFKEAWPGKARYPDVGTCAYVAQGVRIFRDVEEGRKRRKRNLDEEKAVTATKTGAGVFIKHAPSVSRQLEGHLERLTLQVSDTDGPMTLITDERAHAFVAETRDKMEQARVAVAAALDALKIWSAPYGEVDRLLWIRRHMLDAWRSTDGSCPKSTSEDGPVVHFIKLALDSIDDRRKPVAIARALRPSRARQRAV